MCLVLEKNTTALQFSTNYPQSCADQSESEAIFPQKRMNLPIVSIIFCLHYLGFTSCLKSTQLHLAVTSAFD